MAASVQIIIASPEGNGGQLTVTPRATSAARTSARSSTSIAMCSITAAAPSGSRRARASGSCTSISSMLASPHG